MTEIRKWTQQDTHRQQRLIAETKTELLKFEAEFDPAWLEEANINAGWKDEQKVTKKYDAIRMLRQIEGLQQILVYHGAYQPMTSLPFLADYAVEYVKKHGTIGEHRSK